MNYGLHEAVLSSKGNLREVSTRPRVRPSHVGEIPYIDNPNIHSPTRSYVHEVDPQFQAARNDGSWRPEYLSSRNRKR